jgi:hypothetical protein
MLKTRMAQSAALAAEARTASIMDIWRKHGAFLIEGHGHYPVYKAKNTEKSVYVLQHPNPITLPTDRAIIYLSEPGKCMWITTGRQLTARLFHSKEGLEEFLSGAAERKGVHHADVSRKAFVFPDTFIDNKVNLKPQDDQPSFGFVWKLPLEYPRISHNVSFNKDRVPFKKEVLSFKQKDTWVSDIVFKGPPGVYIVSSCLDVPYLPTNYNWPGSPKGFFAPGSPKKARKGVGIRKKLLGVFRSGVSKFKSKPKSVVTKSVKESRASGTGSGRMRYTPFPNSPNNLYKKELKNKEKIKIFKKFGFKVSNILGKLQTNSKINLSKTPGMTANRGIQKKLAYTQTALQMFRTSPKRFMSVPNLPRITKLALKLAPSMAASSIYRAINRNPELGKKISSVANRTSVNTNKNKNGSSAGRSA